MIHDEIHAHADLFRRLSDEFDRYAAQEGGVSLSLLRLYDILVWMKVTNHKPVAKRH